jgi:hypothetical protein
VRFTLRDANKDQGEAPELLRQNNIITRCGLKKVLIPYNDAQRLLRKELAEDVWRIVSNEAD